MRPPGQEVMRICLSRPGSGSGLGRQAPYFTCCVRAQNHPTKGHIETNFCTTSRLGVLTPWRREEAIPYQSTIHHALHLVGGRVGARLGAVLNCSKVRISSQCWLLSNYRHGAPLRTHTQSHLCKRPPLCARPPLYCPRC